MSILTRRPGTRRPNARFPGKGRPIEWASQWARVMPASVFVVLALALLVVAPLVLSSFRLSLLARFCCYAMVALGIGLAWGRGGMLTLGQGLFFGLGAYLMAMHLKLVDAGPGKAPDFMRLYGDGTVPGWWEPFRSPLLTLVAIPVVPGLVALILGLAVFKRRVKGAYFTILSQALAAAFAVFLVGQQTTTGGTNGINGFRSFFGYALNDPVNKATLYYIVAATLLLMIAGMWLLYRSRYNELLIAVRDGEERVRFLGYDPANIKVFAYVVAAVLAGIGGALFVPIAGIISPADVGVLPSIGFLIGVAIGGRSTLLGPVLGTIAVASAQNTLSESFPSFWTYFQGALFIVVVTFLPGGLAQLTGTRRRSNAPPTVSAPATSPTPAAHTASKAPASTVHEDAPNAAHRSKPASEATG